LYTFPLNFSAGFLKGKQVEMLCFATCSFYIHFGDKIIITVEGSFQHYKLAEFSCEDLKPPLVESKLMRLVGVDVLEVEIIEESSLFFTFSNGDALLLKGDNGPYESFHLKI
jgi:hypothetical protein